MDWEELYIKYSDAVYHYVFLIVGNQEIAEDLTHDAFVRVKHSLNRFRGESSHYTWILSIARNVTYDYLRRKKLIQFVPFVSSDLKGNIVTPAEFINRKESVQELYQAIKRLKISYQEVIILRYIQELSIQETAAVLGCSTNKVKSRSFSAMKKLKVELLDKEVQLNEGLR